MESIDRVLVGLELREEDLSLIKYTKELVDIIKPKKIDFIHVEANLEVELDEIKSFTPRDEKIEKMMRDEVSLYFNNSGIEVDFEVVEGNAEEQILHWAAIKKSDLIVLGRKQDKKHAEVTLEKIVRTSPCSVMIIPDNAPLGFNSFLFPVDYSTKTIEGIKLINKQFMFPTIQALHFFDLPTGYYKTGKTAEEFTLILDNNCKKEAEKCIKDIPDTENLSFKNVCSDDIDEFDYIIDYAKANNNNVIAVGSRGRTNAAALLMGSFAEKLVRHNRRYPMFIFKTKGENMDFLKAFLRF